MKTFVFVFPKTELFMSLNNSFSNSVVAFLFSLLRVQSNVGCHPWAWTVVVLEQGGVLAISVGSRCLWCRTHDSGFWPFWLS